MRIQRNFRHGGEYITFYAILLTFEGIHLSITPRFCNFCLMICYFCLFQLKFGEMKTYWLLGPGVKRAPSNMFKENDLQGQTDKKVSE